MSRVRTQLIQLLKEKHGDNVTVEQVLDTLYRCGAIDDNLMRRAVVHELYYERLASTSITTRQVEFDLAHEYDMTRSTVQYIVRRAVA